MLSNCFLNGMERNGIEMELRARAKKMNAIENGKSF